MDIQMIGLSRHIWSSAGLIDSVEAVQSGLPTAIFHASSSSESTSLLPAFYECLTQSILTLFSYAARPCRCALTRPQLLTNRVEASPSHRKEQQPLKLPKTHPDTPQHSLEALSKCVVEEVKERQSASSHVSSPNPVARRRSRTHSGYLPTRRRKRWTPTQKLRGSGFESGMRSLSSVQSSLSGKPRPEFRPMPAMR
jgi:hypothetical protein